MTHRLTESPACLVADLHDMSGNLARLLKAAGQQGPAMKPILEINPKHPVVLRLKDDDKKFDDWAAVLLDQALLAEGGQLDDPATFVQADQRADAGDERRRVADHPARLSAGVSAAIGRHRRAGDSRQTPG